MAEIANLVASIAACIAAIAALIVSLRGNNKIEEIHVATNSRMDEMLEMVKEASYAAGKESERTKGN